ncbi:MAG: DUF1593 domain-containing protein [Lunatimonas sp.]|uniref:DUF1593 domain-containing protein n=1 Tax=Lunatimonas sp. TaxID=2060141 RepID=UPI00263AA283|nr:nucleoside hydrolase-like domain-containing protein [Lunatimonas sp.]MCC5939175.1 DUF1593 domain-containing protein [Lunatimonas sp.]
MKMALRFLWNVSFVFILGLGLVFGQSKPQVFLLTDIGGDTDDEQSLTRFLYYADHLDIKALCATSRLGHGQDTKPELLRAHVQAYREVYPNLQLHSSEFPSPDYLESIIKDGRGNHQQVGEGFDSEASDFLIHVVDESTAVVHIPVWGGLRELAQALWKVKNSRSEAEVEAFCQKILVHAIGDQDGHRAWILQNFKQLPFIANGFAWQGSAGVRELSAFRGMYMTGDTSMQDGDWVRGNIHGNGPLSDRYQLHGHGTNGMKEGDSPSFMGLLANGLNVPENPEWGGWGGRYRRLNQQLYIDVPDFMDGKLNERHTVARWRPAFQRDFMARVKWATESVENSNHSPQVVVNGQDGTLPVFLHARPGELIALDASASKDPDGDALSFRWFVYEEIYKPSEPVQFQFVENSRKVRFEFPDMPVGEQLHLILEVTDSGRPSLTSYRRIIFTAEAGKAVQ